MTAAAADRRQGVLAHQDAIAWLLCELGARERRSSPGPQEIPSWMAALHDVDDDLELARLFSALLVTTADVIRVSELAARVGDLRGHPSPRLLLLVMADRFELERQQLEAALSRPAAPPAATSPDPMSRQSARVGHRIRRLLGRRRRP